VPKTEAAEEVDMQFGADSCLVGPRNHVSNGIKVGRIHSNLVKATSRHCGLSSKFFDQLLSTG